MINLKLIVFIVIFLILNSTLSQSQTVRGDGVVIRENRNIPSFNKIQTGGVLNIFLSQGSIESIVVETDRNLINYVETYVKGEALIIKNKDDVEIKKKTKMNVYITLKDIKKMNIDGVGNVKCQTQLDLATLDLDNNGVGNIQLDLKCDRLKADINSVGGVTLSGRVREVSIDHNGVGNVEAFDLVANILKIHSNGVGNSEVNSEDELYIHLNGIGNVSYKGNAVLKELDIHGRGKVQKM